MEQGYLPPQANAPPFLSGQNFCESREKGGKHPRALRVPGPCFCDAGDQGNILNSLPADSSEILLTNQENKLNLLSGPRETLSHELGLVAAGSQGFFVDRKRLP